MKFTARLFFLFCTVVAVGYSPLIFANQQPQVSKGERQYIHPKSIHFTKKGIVVMD